MFLFFIFFFDYILYMIIQYKEKYLKYKAKYIKLQLLFGGNFKTAKQMYLEQQQRCEDIITYG